jgi:hypothetical protein
VTDIGDLLQKHGAPLPNAIAMETEVRSEGAFMLQKLNVPAWAKNTAPSSVLAEWRSTLSREDVRALQALLKTVLPHGITVQEAVNEAFKKLDIGCYLGTYIEEGLLPDGQATVRVLFAYMSSANNIEEINRRIHGLLTNDGPHGDAGASLQKIRDLWRKGTDKWEGGMMMLSEVNLYDPGRFPYTRAALGAAPGAP